MDSNHYIASSLELHLFFGRIMKEHALFLKAGFTPANGAFARKAEFFKQEFERLLCQAVLLADGSVEQSLLQSGELVTEFTALAEKQTEAFTGIPINKGITAKELRLRSGCGRWEAGTLSRVKQLNRRALELLDGLIVFKERILEHMLHCNMFTMNYPLLIEHIIREAKLYREYVQTLEREGCLPETAVCETERFWNRIMMEHALFIRGLLDPAETELVETADGFAEIYERLLETSRQAHDRTLDPLEETQKFKAFKMAGTQGITDCKIRSVILPLLADHVLREANHYIRLLTEQDSKNCCT